MNVQYVLRIQKYIHFIDVLNVIPIGIQLKKIAQYAEDTNHLLTI